MGGHGGYRDGRRWPGGHGRSGSTGDYGAPGAHLGGGPPGGPGPDGPPPRPRPIVWAAVLLGVAVWSLVAWVAYGLVDGGLGWLGGNAAALAERGRGLAGAAGMGREYGAAVEGVNATGVLGALQGVLRPIILLVWLVGTAALLAAPLILARIVGRMSSRGPQ